LELDRISVSVADARLKMIDRQMRYRDGLDTWRAGLGLSPHAPVVPDREALAGFRDVFEAAERWSVAPGRDLEQLDQVVSKLPRPDDLKIGDRWLFWVLSDGTMENLETDGARIALQHRGQGEDGVELELKVRRRIRGLSQGWMSYQIETRRFVLNLRRRSQAREQLIAPPQDGSRRPLAPIAELVAIQGQILENRDRLVGLWAKHQAERLALLRDLGSLPAVDWKTFLVLFEAWPNEPAPRVIAPGDPVPLAPPPPR
jgi:hypothetical protein